jgi:hypothetical protein
MTNSEPSADLLPKTQISLIGFLHLCRGPLFLVPKRAYFLYHHELSSIILMGGWVLRYFVWGGVGTNNQCCCEPPDSISGINYGFGQTSQFSIKQKGSWVKANPKRSKRLTGNKNYANVQYDQITCL